MSHVRGEGELLTYHPDRQGPSSSLDWQEPSFTGRSYGSCQAGDLNAVTTAQRFTVQATTRGQAQGMGGASGF